MLSIRHRVPAALRPVLVLAVLLAGLLAGTAPHARRPRPRTPPSPSG
ncbi:hypothetical protein ACIP10_32965 [Streptomyces galbus]